MSVIASIVRRLFVVSAMLSLAACGGGGGGGGGSNDAYSVSPLGITFVATQNGTTPPPQQVSVSVNSGTVYIRVDMAGSAITSAVFQVTGSTTGTITITPTSPTMSPGTYSSTVTVYGCADLYCTSSVAGSPKVINVTYTIQPRSGFSATPQSLSFSHLQPAAAPAPQALTLSEITGGSYAWSASISYLSGSGWLTVNGASQVSGASLPTSLSVGINPLSSIGTYSAVIHVTGNGNAIDIPVSYTVRVPQVTATPTPLAFSAISHDTATPATQNVTLSTEAGLSANYSAVVIYGAGASGWLSAPATGSAPSSMTVGVNTTNINAGTYTATLQLTTATQNLSIPVSYTVRAPQVTRSPTQLSFSAFRLGATPSAQSVTINTENSISVPYTTSVSYGVGASGWLTVPASGTAPGSLSVAVNTTNLGMGSYTATITVQPGNGATSFAVGVTYQVQNASLTITPGQLSSTIDNSSVSADLTRSIAVGDTGLAMSWTAVASVPWLSIGTASGTTMGNGTTTVVSLALVGSELEKLNTGSHAGNVTFSYTRPDASVATVQLAVTLNMNMTMVNFVAPYVALPNTSQEVIVRGSGFNHATGLPVMFGSNAVSNYSVVSDTEIRATHPLLTTNSYQVSIPNQLGINRTRASLVVAAAPSFTYAVLPTSLVRGRTIYDAERTAVYTNNQTTYFGLGGIPRIERHRLTAGGWVTDSIPITGFPVDMAVTPDGRELIVISLNVLYHVDLATWTIASQLPVASASPYNNSDFGQLAMGNDGNLLVFGTQWSRPSKYNVLTKQFATISNLWFWSVRATTSGDGSRVFITQNSNDPAQYYDVSHEQFVSTGYDLTNSYTSYDRTGSTLITGGSVYNRQFLLQGTSSNLISSVVSADGTRGYGFVYGITGGTLRTYDLTSPDGNGGFTEIGTGITIPDSPGDFATLGISSDRRAVFISGEAKFIVQPVP